MTRMIDRIEKAVHSSGLKIMLCEKPEFSKTYAVYAVNFGSVNNRYTFEGEDVALPDGTAHFLEHKLFENEEGDAFGLFAGVGGNANAFTDFDATAYLFSCTDNFEKNLEILLDFVKRPYFTEKSIAKEQGIIGQEIGMYDDDPDWRRMFGMLEAMYSDSPVRIDIAGTAKTIARITPKTLYGVYNAFYRPENMALCVCGPVTMERILAAADRFLVKKPGQTAKTAEFAEKRETAKKKTVQNFDVARPMFTLGIKDFEGLRLSGKEAYRREFAMTILIEMLAGYGSFVYNDLYKKGLIDRSFSCYYEGSYSYAHLIFDGESEDPDAAADAIRKEFIGAERNGLVREDFERCKKAVYGRLLLQCNSPERIANFMFRAEFRGADYQELFSLFDAIDYDYVSELVKSLDFEGGYTLSVVTPFKED